MTTASYPASGVFSKLLIKSGLPPYTWTAATRYDIIAEPAETFQKHSRIIEARGITGGLHPLKSRVRTGPGLVFGSFRLHPSIGTLKSLMPFLMGSLGVYPAEVIYTPDRCLATFGALMLRDLDLWEYQSGVVAAWELTGTKADFQASSGQDIPNETGSSLLLLKINVIFLEEVSPLAAVPPTWPDPEPALQITREYAPLSFVDTSGTITMSGASREVYGFRLKYDNRIDPALVNALSLKTLTCPGRRVDFDVILPWQANNQNLYDEAVTGAAASLKVGYNDGGGDSSVQFDLMNMKQDEASSPNVNDYGDVAFEVSGRAYGTANEQEISATVVIS